MQTMTYGSILAASEKVSWTLDDVLSPADRLDFTKPFMPECFARTAAETGLTPKERLTLNHIRGNDYLCSFGIVEEFILPFVLDHVRPSLAENDERVRALLAFAGEEAKHIHLFKRFKERFEEGFGSRCEMIGPAEAVASAVLSNAPLAVALLILHLEWMTQLHYVESVKDASDLDHCFRSLLRHHWMEEAQHAKLDLLMLDALLEGATAEEKVSAVDSYLAILGEFDAAYRQQSEFNADALERATGRKLGADERKGLVERQHQAMRWTYFGSGMTHPEMLAALDKVGPGQREKVLAAAQKYR